MYLRRAALALKGAAEIVDNDVGSSRGEEEGICLPQATTGTGDDNGLSRKAKF